MKKSILVLSTLLTILGCGSATDDGAARPAVATDPNGAARAGLTVYRIPVDGLPAVGKRDALVTAVVFGDYECPFCRRLEASLAELRARQDGDLRVVYASRP